jgi:mutator protein MutT
MRNSTLLFLVKKEDGIIKDICLAMKKRGFGAGRYNGVGGKVEAGESIEAAVLREAEEEIGIHAEGVRKYGELTFVFPHNPQYDQLVHVYVTQSWTGEPVETEEMSPAWFPVEGIPYGSMWPDDAFWLPKVINGQPVRARFVFGEGDSILEQEVRLTDEEREPALIP